MEKLIVPRHTADLEYIIPAIKVYYDAKDWVTTSDYKDRLYNLLYASGKESQRNSDETHYTKCSEIPRYFGLLERKNPGKSSSDVKITESGIRFYESYLEKNYVKIHEVIIEALENISFGRNNEGCGSDTILEAPNILIISSILIDGITNKEGAYILGQLLDFQQELTPTLMKVLEKRCSSDINLSSSVTSDIKFIPFLKRIKFLDENSDRRTIVSRDVLDLFKERLLKLRLKNSGRDMLKLYTYFIENCTAKAKSISHYTDFKRINECIGLLGLEKYKTLLDVDKPDVLEDIHERLKALPKYKEYNDIGNHQYTATVGTYLQFLYALQLSEQYTRNDDDIDETPSLHEIKEASTVDSDQSFISTKYDDIITAAKTKPFILLAGISGTGKSRIVRELARAYWAEGSDEYKAQKPENFEMIQVKPNWHDSTELMGYVSRVSGEPVYIIGDFLRFVAKAWDNIKVPHFLCLDEMNLAPVEQYFAEFLSVIESRKSDSDGTVTTDPILKKSTEDWYRVLTAELTGSNEALREQFLNEGITLPQNLIVVGTVNMDETTFSFSRKVLDRAMTIEMNEVDLWGGLDNKYERIGKLTGNMLIGTAVEGVDVYADNKEVCDIALTYLEAVNEVLEGTPFKVAYRTRNEFLLYVVNNLPYTIGEDGTEYSRENVIATALDEITSMKILSRIEGDDTKVPRTLLNGLKHCIEAQLLAITGEDDKIESVSIAKLDEMLQRLESGYTSFWS